MNNEPTTTHSPSLVYALLILLPTFVVLPLVGRYSGVDYDVIADNTTNVLSGIVPMVGVSLIYGLFMAWRSGWLKPIFAKQAPSTFPKFFWLIPICWFGLCLIRLLFSPWTSFDATYLIVLAIAMIMVGFNEEILFRGILTYGARGSGPWSEARTMLVSAVGFGLFHLPNLLIGQALGPTLIQITYAFFMGIALTVSMRISQTIMLPVAMHALWDFSTFTSKAHPPSPMFSYVSFALLVLTIILIFFAIIWCLGKKRQPVST